MARMRKCSVCGGNLEKSDQYPNAGYLHANDADDTHKPKLARRTLDERIDAGEFQAYIDNAAFNAGRFTVPGLVNRLVSTHQALQLTAENTATRNGPGRRGRASALSALKRAIEHETGTRLTLVTTHHSETWDFMHATYATYTIKRGEA